MYYRWGWRPAFVLPGLLGFVWLAVWRRTYHTPQEHPRISEAERQMILADAQDPGVRASQPKPRWGALLKLPQTWGTIVAKGLTDPVWFFVTDWFPIYLVAKGISLKSSLLAIWVPFIASELGNFFGGAASGYLIKRGWSLGAARKALVVFGGSACCCSFLRFSHSTCGQSLHFSPWLRFPMRRFPPSPTFCLRTGAGIGTIVAFELIGYFSDARRTAGAHSFDPIIIVAGLIPFLAMILVLLLVRNTRATEEGLVRRI